MTASRASNVTQFPQSARGKKKRVDTIVLDDATTKQFRNPSFQRPFKMTASVQAVMEEIRETAVFPGILTLGLFDGAVWVIDGQHRLEAVRLTELKDVLADVHYLECDSIEEMAHEFRKLNSAIVKFGPDDILRAREVSHPGLQTIRQKCKFVGYDNIRRGTSSPIVGMSQTLRAWLMSEPETPGGSQGSAAIMADRLTAEEAENLCGFLRLAFEAWGKEQAYARLWAQLNLTLCMWLYRRMVLAPVIKSQRRTHLNKEQFGRCLLSLSADSLYLDYIVNRKLNNDHRSATYHRIRQIFTRRLHDTESIARAVFPSPVWVSGH